MVFSFFNNFYKHPCFPEFNMIVKLMGVLDLFTALVIILFQYKMIHNPLIVSLGFYLIMKTIIFFGDLFSIIDGVIGLYVLFMMVWPIEVVSFICMGYLVIKGFSSLV
jgi:hypothetical protein